MIDTLKIIILWSLGAWAWYAIYRDIKTKPKVRKFVYWFSAVVVPFAAYIFSLARSTT